MDKIKALEYKTLRLFWFCKVRKKRFSVEKNWLWNTVTIFWNIINIFKIKNKYLVNHFQKR